jgi:hypothetical protein
MPGPVALVRLIQANAARALFMAYLLFGTAYGSLRQDLHTAFLVLKYIIDPI